MACPPQCVFIAPQPFLSPCPIIQFFPFCLTPIHSFLSSNIHTYKLNNPRSDSSSIFQMAPRVSSTSNRIVSRSNVTPSSQLQKTPASTTLDSIPALSSPSNHPQTMPYNTPNQSAPIVASLQVSGASCASKTPHLTRPTPSSVSLLRSIALLS